MPCVIALVWSWSHIVSRARVRLSSHGWVMMSSQAPGLPPALSEPRSQVKCEDTEYQPRPLTKLTTPASPNPRNIGRCQQTRPGSSWGIMPLDNGTPPYKLSRRNSGAGGNQLGPGPALSTNERPVFGSRDPSRPIRAGDQHQNESVTLKYSLVLGANIF